MAARRPVIYYGPENIAMIELIQKEKTALCVTNRDCKLLVNTIEMALDNDEACKPMISRAFKLAKEKFDKEAVSEKFRMLLIDLIGKNK